MVLSLLNTLFIAIPPVALLTVPLSVTGLMQAVIKTELVVLLQPVEVCVNVNVTEPGATPVTTPPFVTVAKLLLLLTHVPPVVGDKVIVDPTQTDDAPLTIGKAFTVTGFVVALQPVEVWVNVNVTEPGATPDTTPPFVTVAKLLLLLTHVPPVVGKTFIIEPIQIVDIGIWIVGV